MKDLKSCIEVILIIILIVCLYNGECKLVGDMLNNNLGKVVLLGLVVFIVTYFGKTAGALAACIFILVLHLHRREGFQEGAGLKIEMGNDTADKEKTKQKKEEEKTKQKEKDDDEEKEGFSIRIGGDPEPKKPQKEGYWEKKNREGIDEDEDTEAVIESMKNQIRKIAKKVKKLEKKKEGFANLRQNRRLKINNLSVLNTTDLDRIIKKDSEVRTINSTS